MNSTRYIGALLICLLRVIPAYGQATHHTDSLNPNGMEVILKEVTVTKSRETKMTGALSGNIKLHSAGLRKLPALLGNTDLLKMFEFTPGLQTSGDANSNLYVRGGEPGQNLLTYDGATLYTPGHVLNIFPLFNPDHTTSVELLKSGTPARYGGFLSSIIRAESSDIIPERCAVDGNVGMIASQATFALPVNKRTGLYVSYRQTYLDLILMPVLKSSENTGDDELSYNFYDTNATLLSQLSAKSRLKVNLFYGKDKLKLTENDILIDGFMKWSNLASSATLTTRYAADTRMEQRFSYSDFKNRIMTSQGGMSVMLKAAVKQMNYMHEIMYRLTENIKAESGVDMSYYRVQPQETAFRNLGADLKHAISKPNKALSFSAYTQFRMQATGRWTVEPGLRYNLFHAKISDENGTKSFHSVDMRLSARYRLSTNKYLRGGYSHNTQYVNKLTPASIGLPTDFWVNASKKIRPQRGDECSIGYYQTLDRKGNYELSTDLFYRKIKHVTTYNQQMVEHDTKPFYENIQYGKGEVYGWELMIKKNHGRLTGWISLSAGKATRRFDDINDGETFHARFDRTADASLVAVYTFNTRWDMSLAYKYATGNRYTQPTSWYVINNMPVKEYGKYNNAKMPDYNRTDISVNYHLSAHHSFNMSVYNMCMVNNPMYVFLSVSADKEAGELTIRTKKKKLMTIVPSISWRFNF